MTGEGVPRPVRRRLDHDDGDGREELVGVGPKATERAQDLGRARRVERERAEGASQLAHLRGGIDSLAADVADDGADLTIGPGEDVEPVTPDVRLGAARQVAGCDPQALEQRQGAGQRAPLKRLRDALLAGVEARVLERLSRLATEHRDRPELGFERVGVAVDEQRATRALSSERPSDVRTTVWPSGPAIWSGSPRVGLASARADHRVHLLAERVVLLLEPLPDSVAQRRRLRARRRRPPRRPAPRPHPPHRRAARPDA